MALTPQEQAELDALNAAAAEGDANPVFTKADAEELARLEAMDSPAPADGPLDLLVDAGMRAIDYTSGPIRAGAAVPLEIASRLAGKGGVFREGDFTRIATGAGPSMVEYYDRSGLPKGPAESVTTFGITPAGVAMGVADIVISPKSTLAALKKLRGAGKASELEKMTAQKLRELHRIDKAQREALAAEKPLKKLGRNAVSVAKSLAMGTTLQDAAKSGGKALYKSAEPMRAADHAAKLKGRMLVPSDIMLDKKITGGGERVHDQVIQAIKDNGAVAGAIHAKAEKFKVPIDPYPLIDATYADANEMLKSSHTEMRKAGRQAKQEALLMDNRWTQSDEYPPEYRASAREFKKHIEEAGDLAERMGQYDADPRFAPVGRNKALQQRVGREIQENAYDAADAELRKKGHIAPNEPSLGARLYETNQRLAALKDAEEATRVNPSWNRTLLPNRGDIALAVPLATSVGMATGSGWAALLAAMATKAARSTPARTGLGASMYSLGRLPIDNAARFGGLRILDDKDRMAPYRGILMEDLEGITP